MIVQPFISFLLLVLALYATPGPATLSIAAAGAAYGFRRTIGYVTGIVVGLVPIFVTVATGLGVLFSTYPTFHAIFKWVSFAYILYLAYKIATSTRADVDFEDKPLGFWNGLLLTVLNPKAYVAVLTPVAQFTMPGDQYFQTLLVLTIWIIVLAFIIDSAWAYAGVVIGSKTKSSKAEKWINRLFACLLVISVLMTIV